MQLEAVKLKEAVYTTDLAANDEFISVAEFEDATRTVVRTLGKNFGVDVVFGGANAGNNGEVIVLPSQDSAKMMTRLQYGVAQGFANQEALHCLCTDNPYYERMKKRLEEEKKPLTSAYADIIEDIRIERAGQTLYPGMPSQLGATADFTTRKVLDMIGGDEEIMNDLGKVGPLALGWRARQRMGNSTPAIDDALSRLTKENLKQLDQWCEQVEKLETGAKRPGVFDKKISQTASRDVFELAATIAEETMLPPEDSDGQGGSEDGGKDDQEDKSGQGGNGQGQEGEQESAAGESEDGEGDEDGEGQNKEEREGAGKNAGKPEKTKGTPNHGATHGHEPIPVPLDTKGMLKELLQENEPSTGNASRPVTTCLDLVATRATQSKMVQNVLNAKEGNKLYAEVSAQISGKLAVMKRKFERALLTAQETDYVSGQRRGKLDIRKKGVQILSGQETVYRQKTEGKDINTAVTILVDASGSMQGVKMHLATAVCVALAECMSQTTVKLEILAFDTSTCSDAFPDSVHRAYHDITAGLTAADVQKFHRNGPITTWVIKDFKDSLREAKISLGNMMQFGFDANADGDSILEATKRLVKEKANKKILLVLSDGSPAYHMLSGNPHEHTKKCIQNAIDKGIHTIGIGIKSTAVSHYYPKYVVVNDYNDLDKTVIDKLARLILGEEFRVDNADLNKKVA